MAKEPLTLEALTTAVTPLERKYDWKAEGTAEGVFELTLTDGSHEARGEVTSLEGIEELVKKLETEIDGQDYPVIG